MITLLNYEHGAISVATQYFAWSTTQIQQCVNGSWRDLTPKVVAGLRLGAYLGNKPEVERRQVGYLDQDADRLVLSPLSAQTPLIVGSHDLHSVRNFQLKGNLRNINPDGNPILNWTGQTAKNLLSGTTGHYHLSLGDEDWLYSAPWGTVSRYSKEKVRRYWFYATRCVDTKYGPAVAAIVLANSYLEQHENATSYWDSRIQFNCYIWAYDRVDHAWYAQDANFFNQLRPIYYNTAEEPEAVYGRFIQAVDVWVEASSRRHGNALSWYQTTLNSPPSRNLPCYYMNWEEGAYVPSSIIWKYNEDSIFPPNRRNPNWRDMARDAYQDLGFWNGNGIAYVKDLFELGSSVRNTLQTIRSLGSGKLKAVASLYLSFHFGWKLMAIDTAELAQALENVPQSARCRAHSEWTADSPWENSRYYATYTVDYKTFEQLTSELRKLQSLLDLDLQADNIWDMVPFSFVVDWFVNLGEVLTSLDNYFNLRQKHRVLACERSIRCSADVTPQKAGLYGWYGDLQAVYYAREYLSRPIEPSLLPSVAIKPTVTHAVEAAALIVSSH